MKAAKFIVLAGGVFGLLAFFLPLMSGSAGNGTDVSISAFQIVKGVDKASDIATHESEAVNRELTAASEYDEAGGAAISEIAARVRTWVLIAFVPTFLFLLFGGLGTKKKAFGRGPGITSLVVGLLATGIGALLVTALGEADATGVGAYLMLVGGLAGFVGGLLGTIKPERALAAA